MNLIRVYWIRITDITCCVLLVVSFEDIRNSNECSSTWVIDTTTVVTHGESLYDTWVLP